jgi:hypothetical protein
MPDALIRPSVFRSFWEARASARIPFWPKFSLSALNRPDQLDSLLNLTKHFRQLVTASADKVSRRHKTFDLLINKPSLLTLAFTTDGCPQIRRRASQEEAVRRPAIPSPSPLLGGELPDMTLQAWAKSPPRPLRPIAAVALFCVLLYTR